jgi:hypothetical protein
LPAKKRHEIESRLSHYSIPIQILQLAAESCGCRAISAETRIKDSGRNANSLPLLAALDDRSIMLLEQIFLDCHDSFSNFRLAVFMSSKWPSMQHKFVMPGTVRGASGQEYAFDVYIQDRDTEELVALGMQNNDAGQKASGSQSLRLVLDASQTCTRLIRDCAARIASLRTSTRTGTPRAWSSRLWQRGAAATSSF